MSGLSFLPGKRWQLTLLLTPPDFPSTVGLFLLFHPAPCLFPLLTPWRGSRDACSAGDPALMPEGQVLQILLLP